MKSKNISLLAGAVLAASVMIAGNTARAEDLPQTKAHQQFSVRQGFSASDVAVLERAGAVDQNKVGSALIRNLQLGAHQSSKNGAKLHFAGNQWSLDIAADGSAADYQNQAVAARAHSLGKPESEKMSSAQ